MEAQGQVTQDKGGFSLLHSLTSLPSGKTDTTTVGDYIPYSTWHTDEIVKAVSCTCRTAWQKRKASQPPWSQGESYEWGQKRDWFGFYMYNGETPDMMRILNKKWENKNKREKRKGNLKSQEKQKQCKKANVIFKLTGLWREQYLHGLTNKNVHWFSKFRINSQTKHGKQLWLKNSR